MQVVGVEVFVRSGAGEEEVEQFQNQKLKRGLAFTVQEQDYVLPERLVPRAMRTQHVDDFIRDLGGGRPWLVRGGVMGADHVLFIEDELCRQSAGILLGLFKK